jgi:hypothetical protein
MSLAWWNVRAGALAALAVAWIAPAPANGQDSKVGGDTNTPPVIVGLDATQLAGKKFRISGRVADNTPGSCTVKLSGAASGSAACDSTGKFSGVFDVPAIGEVIAVASDGELSSEPAARQLTNDAPTITIKAVRNLRTWTFSGTVGDEAPAGLTVTLTGCGTGSNSTTVAADGSWSISLTGLPAAGGTANATVTDWYGLTGSARTPWGE